MARKRPPVRRVTPIVQLTLPAELVHVLDRWAERESRRRLGARVTRSQAVRELLAYALKARQPVRAYRLGEEPAVDEETARLSPEERVAMIGDLSITAYEMGGKRVVPGIRRDVVRVVRRRR